MIKSLLKYSSVAIAGVTALSLPILMGQNSAQAGQGGLAAAVSFTVDDSQNVNGVAAAVGIGKTDAAASAFFEVDPVDGFFNGSATALGSSSPITIEDIDAIDIEYMESTGDRGDRDLDTPQANEIDGLALIASNGDLIGGGVITFGSVIDAFTGP
ncbi:MAG: hypothetical protein Kow0091_19880 [Geminocystis sp.]